MYCYYWLSRLMCYFYRVHVLLSFAFIFFFFSSRRRHTRYWRDWSSDVCSSDLGGGFEVVDERHALAPERVGERACVHVPGEVGGVHEVVNDGAGDAEAGVRDVRPVLGDELPDDGFERRVSVAREALLRGGRAQGFAVRLEQRDVRLRPANVSGNNHTSHV